MPQSDRTTVRRGAKRAEYRVEEIRQILRLGSVAHVAAMTPEGPLVLPMAYGISGETVYLHGALANALLRSGADAEICATVTIVDGSCLPRLRLTIGVETCTPDSPIAPNGAGWFQGHAQGRAVQRGHPWAYRATASVRSIPI